MGDVIGFLLGIGPMNSIYVSTTCIQHLGTTSLGQLLKQLRVVIIEVYKQRP